MINENQIPVMEKTSSFQELKLTPEDFFILSRINGALTVKQIVQIVGFPFEKVSLSLQKLLDQQVISIKQEDTDEKKIKQPIEGHHPSMIELLDQEDKDPILSKIPRSFRNRILLQFQELPKMNYFEMLEVSPSATSEEIQNSYLRLVKEFHPDRMRGQEAGHYKQKLESIFDKIQEASQKIRHDNQRAAYLHSLMEARRTTKDPNEGKAKSEYRLPRKNTKLHFANADSQYEMGIKEEKKGNLQSALNFYQMAISLNPQRKIFEDAYHRVRKLLREGY